MRGELERLFGNVTNTLVKKPKIIDLGKQTIVKEKIRDELLVSKITGYLDLIRLAGLANVDGSHYWDEVAGERLAFLSNDMAGFLSVNAKNANQKVKVFFDRPEEGKANVGMESNARRVVFVFDKINRCYSYLATKTIGKESHPYKLDLPNGGIDDLCGLVSLELDIALPLTTGASSS